MKMVYVNKALPEYEEHHNKQFLVYQDHILGWKIASYDWDNPGFNAFYDDNDYVLKEVTNWAALPFTPEEMD